MKVWFCEVHRSVGTDTGCDGLEIVRFFHEPESPCRMVAMRLIPDNAETGIDREVLAAALSRVVELEQPRDWSEDQWQDLAIVEDAALERLTQLAEQCATCGGSGYWTNRGATEREYLEGLKEEPCPTCGGSGLVAALDGDVPKEAPKDFHETQGRAWGGNL